ncbi:uncharacterized protein LOC127725190 [Mytilus californianus]|uniref:uncharacterized protein LOC127725190 n=1 Tax=Mytilus californianus TaxID=6549 RepID=UPI0022483616|nr:uncharacterized protein LOC127725190 [Mytilus californianus]
MFGCLTGLLSQRDGKRFIHKVHSKIRQHHTLTACCLLLLSLIILFNIFFRRLSVDYAPFIWSNDNPSWFNVTFVEFASSPVQLVGSVTVDSENILSLKQNHREVYRQLGKILNDNDEKKLQAWHGLDTRLKLGGRIATFNDVVVSSDGWIVDSKYDLAVRNGGCQTTTNLLVRKFLVTRYRSVITIAARWCEGIWHFPMEALVGLAHITEYNKQNSFIHVSEKNEWVMQWLKLIGVNKNRVIHGTISADTLIVPQMAKCGSPSLDQLQWLRKSIPLKIPLNKQSILLIKRTRKRMMPNFDEIQSLVEKFAKEVDLDFVLHDDRSLPSLTLQLERFSKASIVIGPHGAGMVNLIASKNRTCVIEFSPTVSNTCYMSLSYLLGHNYFSVPLYENQTVKIHKVEKALNACPRTT